MFDLAQLQRAQQVVHAAMPPTPAHAWPLLSERLGATAIVKHENHTPVSYTHLDVYKRQVHGASWAPFYFRK